MALANGQRSSTTPAVSAVFQRLARQRLIRFHAFLSPRVLIHDSALDDPPVQEVDDKQPVLPDG